MLPPMRLPYVLLQLPNLGQQGPVPREKVVAGLFLSSSAPPTPIIVCLANPVFQTYIGRWRHVLTATGSTVLPLALALTGGACV